MGPARFHCATLLHSGYVGKCVADTPKFPETRQLSTTPASAPSAAEPERVETDVVPVGTADTTEGQGETAADSDDEMCVTSATLKRPLDDSVEQDGASSTSSQEPPAKAPQGRRRSLKPKPKSPVGRDFRLRFETTPPPLRRLRRRLLAAGGRRPVLLYRVVEWTL
ncbi:hypothetical protein MRX96_017889 [Rhipicephalus microplus]